MPQTLTKAELNKILVQERAKSRDRHKRSKFMNSTRGKYTGQENRILKETGQATLPYTLDQFRELVESKLGTPCPYSGVKLSLSNYTADHAEPVSQGGSWGLENIVVCTESSNWQKGNMRSSVFIKLMNGARKIMNDKEYNSFTRRLSTGGKFINNGK